MQIAYAAHTEACTFFLDEDGICRRVVRLRRTTLLGVGTDEADVAERCIGAQYVASLDCQAQGGLIAMPKIGVPMIFAYVSNDGRGRIALVRTGPVTRFEESLGARSSRPPAPPVDPDASAPTLKTPPGGVGVAKPDSGVRARPEEEEEANETASGVSVSVDVSVDEVSGVGDDDAVPTHVFTANEDAVSTQVFTASEDAVRTQVFRSGRAPRLTPPSRTPLPQPIPSRERTTLPAPAPMPLSMRTPLPSLLPTSSGPPTSGTTPTPPEGRPSWMPTTRVERISIAPPPSTIREADPSAPTLREPVPVGDRVAAAGRGMLPMRARAQSLALARATRGRA